MRSPSPNSDSSLSSLSPSPEPIAKELPHPLSPALSLSQSATSQSCQQHLQVPQQHQFPSRLEESQQHPPLHSRTLLLEAEPQISSQSALGLSDIPSLAQAAVATQRRPTVSILDAEARLAQLVPAKSPPERRVYLTPSPTPSRDEWDPADAWIIWPEEKDRPQPRIKHMWTSPMHPPELRFLTLMPEEGYEEGVIYAVVSTSFSLSHISWVTIPSDLRGDEGNES